MINRVRGLSLVLMVAALAAVAVLLMEGSQIGFPDGHWTDYDRAVVPYWNGAGGLFLLNGLVFFLIVLKVIDPQKRSGRTVFLVNLAAMMVVTLAVAAVLPWYLSSVLQLDSGGGG